MTLLSYLVKQPAYIMHYALCINIEGQLKTREI